MLVHCSGREFQDEPITMFSERNCYLIIGRQIKKPTITF